MSSRFHRRISNPLFARLVAGLGAALAVVAVQSPAQADESAYCRRVHARAASDAALLIAPTFRAEALKLPSALEPGAQLAATPTGASYQVRAGGSVSFLNMYKGTRLPIVADADCAQNDAVTAAEELLAQAEDFGRLGALRGEAKALDESRAEWERIAAKMTERFTAQNVTLLNLEDVQTRVTALERRRVQVGGEIKRLEATGLDAHKPDIGALERRIEAASSKLERETAHVRSLDAFDLAITGGYVPPVLDAKNPDFFGVIQLSYNLGGPFRNAAESRYVAARAEEIKTARNETHAHLRLFREHVKAVLFGARGELEIVQKRIAALRVIRGQLDGSEATGAAYAGAMVDLELVALHADEVFLTGYVRELSHVEEK